MRLTDKNRQDLWKAATQALSQAYAPYSRLRVGASVLTANGHIYAGANVENASYGLSLCAERAAIAQAVAYLACAAKSNAVYSAFGAAMEDARNSGSLAVPIHLRNAPTKLMKELGYGNDYKYAHHYENNFVAHEFLPEEIENTKLYEPGNNARENAQREFLKQRWKEKYGY